MKLLCPVRAKCDQTIWMKHLSLRSLKNSVVNEVKQQMYVVHLTSLILVFQKNGNPLSLVVSILSLIILPMMSRSELLNIIASEYDNPPRMYQQILSASSLKAFESLSYLFMRISISSLFKLKSLDRKNLHNQILWLI